MTDLYSTSIIKNIYNTDVYLDNKDLFNEFYINKKKITKLKRNDYKSINNKIIFTNMDINDKYK